MALAVVGTPAAAGNGGNPGNSSITTSFTLDATTNLLLAVISWQDTASTTFSGTPPQWNGIALTQVTGALKEFLGGASAYQGVDFWYLFSPATGANNLVTTANSTTQSIVHGVIGFSGASQSTAPSFKASATNPTANPASQAITSTAGNIVVGILNPYTGTVGNITSNNTQAWEVLENAQQNQVANCAYSTATSPTMSWANTGGVEWVLSTVEIAVSGPTITVQPVAQTKCEGGTVTFTITATGTGTLHYQWARDDGGGFNNIGTDSSSYVSGTLTKAADNGDIYKCTVTDDAGSTASNSVVLTVFSNAAGWFYA